MKNKKRFVKQIDYESIKLIIGKKKSAMKKLSLKSGKKSAYELIDQLANK